MTPLREGDRFQSLPISSREARKKNKQIHRSKIFLLASIEKSFFAPSGASTYFWWPMYKKTYHKVCRLLPEMNAYVTYPLGNYSQIAILCSIRKGCASYSQIISPLVIFGHFLYSKPILPAPWLSIMWVYSCYRYDHWSARRSPTYFVNLTLPLIQKYHLNVPDPQGTWLVLVRTSENACGSYLATGSISASGTAQIWYAPWGGILPLHGFLYKRCLREEIEENNI